jgi:hypothetical protein
MNHSDAVVHRNKEPGAWESWSGDLEELSGVVKQVEKLAQDRKKQILADIHESLREDEETAWKKVEPLVRLEITYGTNSTTGPANAVLKELDRRTVQKVKIFTKFPYHHEESITVQFQKGTIEDKGVEVEVESTSQGWAKQGIGQLSDEIEKSVPKWSFFLSHPGQATVFLVTYIAIFALVTLATIKHVHHDKLGAVGSIALATLFATILLCIPILVLLPRVFPRFEIHGEGGTSTGGGRLAALLTAILAIPIGVIVYLIT